MFPPLQSNHATGEGEFRLQPDVGGGSADKHRVNARMNRQISFGVVSSELVQKNIYGNLPGFARLEHYASKAFKLHRRTICFPWV